MSPPVVGIFDSGVGGLSVVRALVHLFPTLSFIYFGDTGRFPYGTKSPSTIVRYSIENTTFLLEQGAKVIVVACNTATSHALPRLQELFSHPICGVIEPAVKRAVEVTKTGKIGVMGTRGTIRAKSHIKAIKALMPDAEVLALACPLLVSLIEEGAPTKAIERDVVKAYLKPFKKKKVDTLLLGCTHYPLLRPLIQEEMPEVEIIDPAEASAACVGKILKPHIEVQDPFRRFFVSDDPVRFRKVGETFLGFPMPSVRCTRF